MAFPPVFVRSYYSYIFFFVLLFVILKMWDLRFFYKADIFVEFAEFEQGCDVIPVRSTAEVGLW